MERKVIYRDRYEVTAEDLNNSQDWAQQSTDHVVLDTIVPGRKYAGFLVSQDTSTQVKVASGRLYFDGKRYFRDEAEGVTISLNSVKPGLQNRIVAIVSYPQDVETDEQERDYEIDAENEIYEPRAAKMEARRFAVLEAVAGAEAVSPQSPVIPTTAVIIALVTMSTAGITAIRMVDENRVPNLEDVDDRLAEAEDELEEIGPRILTIQSDLSKLDARTREIGDKAIAYSVYEDLAEIKDRLNLSASYVAYRKNLFLDADQSNTGAAGFSARIEEGLRFAPEAVNETQLQLFNAFNADAKVSGAGLLLPAYTAATRRIIRGAAGTMSLAQYAFEARTLTVASMSRERVRYGAEFEVSTGSAAYAGGTFYSAYQGIKNVFAKNNETFQQYDTGKVDPDGHKIVRLASYWVDSVTSPYWTRLANAPVVTGYAWCETFVQPQSGWCTGITPRIVSKPAAGPLVIGICDTYRGEPDYESVLAMVTVNPGDIASPSNLDSWAAAIEPTYLEAGKRYGMFLMTAADYVINVTDIQNGAGGTMFYGLGGGVNFSDPTRHLMFDLRFATFTRSQVAIDLAALSLSGGIASIDILADTIAPAGTDLRYEIQVAGAWSALDEMDASVLAGLPPLVPMRVVMVGSQDLMPGLKLSGSRLRVSRPKTSFKNISTPATLPTASTKITVKTKLRDFDPAHHTYTATILRGATVETADITTDVRRDARTIERTQVFNLAASVTSYVMTNEGATDNAANPFIPTETFELAE
jgi:hypothetical protein